MLYLVILRNFYNIFLIEQRCKYMFMKYINMKNSMEKFKSSFDYWLSEGCGWSRYIEVKEQVVGVDEKENREERRENKILNV